LIYYLDQTTTFKHLYEELLDMTDARRASEERSGESEEVVSAVEERGATEQLVVADITRDEAWVTVDIADAVTTAEWR